MWLTSHISNGISRVLQTLFRYFNGTIFSTTFVLPAMAVFPVILILDWNDSEFV